MGEIKRLPRDVVELIAAGEVVDGPVSVVKELVENSLDAGSSNIDVFLFGGGRERIIVVDDGCGMSREDAKRAFERYSTSKIESLEDLQNIKTFGFRGEALHSISLVSRVELITRREMDPEGTKIVIEGGESIEERSVGCNKGTKITVDKLFFNTPARWEFAGVKKGIVQSLRHLLVRYSFAKPDVSFSFYNDGNLFLKLPSEDTVGRIKRLYGGEIERYLKPIGGVFGDLLIKGFITDPSYVFKDRERFYFYVNGRPIWDKALFAQIKRFLKWSYPRESFPLLIIYLELPPSMVNVNVHPTKREVKFKDKDVVIKSILDALSTAPSSLFVSEREVSYTPRNLEKTGFFSSMRIIGAFKDFLILEDESGLILLHRRRGWERVVYEMVLKDLPSKGFPLGRSIIVEDWDDGMAERLKNLGFLVEKNEGRWAVCGIPRIFAELGINPEVFVKSIKSFSKKDTKESLAELSASLFNYVDKDHMELLRKLDFEVANRNTCPHGKPLWKRLTEKDLSDLFSA